MANVKIKTLSGKILTVELKEKNPTIKNLKIQLEEENSIKQKEQTLYFRNKKLGDEQTIGELDGYNPDENIYLIVGGENTKCFVL